MEIEMVIGKERKIYNIKVNIRKWTRKMRSGDGVGKKKVLFHMIGNNC